MKANAKCDFIPIDLDSALILWLKW